MKKGKRRTRKKNVFVETVSENMRSLKQLCKRRIGVIVAILLTVGIVLSHIHFKDESICAVLCFVSYGIFYFFIDIKKKINATTQSGIPIPFKRYTRVDENELLTVDNPDEAISYLYDLENWMEKKGYLKKKKVEMQIINLE